MRSYPVARLVVEASQIDGNAYPPLAHLGRAGLPSYHQLSPMVMLGDCTRALSPHTALIQDIAMTFDQLRTFVDSSMRMSHIYQPVMLQYLLERGGSASVRDIAATILSHDESQIEYYEQIVKNMVGRVLRNRQVVRKDGQSFELSDFDRLSPGEIAELTDRCQKKLDEFKEARGAKIWNHRKLAEGYISGTLRSKSSGGRNSAANCVGSQRTSKPSKSIISFLETRVAAMISATFRPFVTAATR